MSARASDIHDAAARGDAAKVIALLANGGDPNLAGSLGNTPLHAVSIAYAFNATSVHNPELMATVKALLDAGADPDVANGSGVSAVEYANAYAPVLGRLFHAYCRAHALDAGLPSVPVYQGRPPLASRKQRF